jgi:hypothetical protein
VDHPVFDGLNERISGTAAIFRAERGNSIVHPISATPETRKIHECEIRMDKKRPRIYGDYS